MWFLIEPLMFLIGCFIVVFLLGYFFHKLGLRIVRQKTQESGE